MMSENGRLERSFRVRRPLAQLALTTAVLGILFGLSVMSPEGRFAGFAAAVLGGAVPIIVGPSGLRKHGVLVAAIGIGGMILLSGNVESSPYRVKARMQSAYEMGRQFCEASAAYRQRTGRWPAHVRELEVPGQPWTVSSVALEKDGTIALVLLFPPVKNGALLFVPAGVNGADVWTCRGRDVPMVLLPAGCRENRSE